jgi:hypothetical protein
MSKTYLSAFALILAASPVFAAPSNANPVMSCQVTVEEIGKQGGAKTLMDETFDVELKAIETQGETAYEGKFTKDLPLGIFASASLSVFPAEVNVSIVTTYLLSASGDIASSEGRGNSAYASNSVDLMNLKDGYGAHLLCYTKQ